MALKRSSLNASRQVAFTLCRRGYYLFPGQWWCVKFPSSDSIRLPVCLSFLACNENIAAQSARRLPANWKYGQVSKVRVWARSGSMRAPSASHEHSCTLLIGLHFGCRIADAYKKWKSEIINSINSPKRKQVWANCVLVLVVYHTKNEMSIQCGVYLIGR